MPVQPALTMNERQLALIVTVGGSTARQGLTALPRWDTALPT